MFSLRRPVSLSSSRVSSFGASFVLAFDFVFFTVVFLTGAFLAFAFVAVFFLAGFFDFAEGALLAFGMMTLTLWLGEPIRVGLQSTRPLCRREKIHA